MKNHIREKLEKYLCDVCGWSEDYAEDIAGLIYHKDSPRAIVEYCQRELNSEGIDYTEEVSQHILNGLKQILGYDFTGFRGKRIFVINHLKS